MAITGKHVVGAVVATLFAYGSIRGAKESGRKSGAALGRCKGVMDAVSGRPNHYEEEAKTKSKGE